MPSRRSLSVLLLLLASVFGAILMLPSAQGTGTHASHAGASHATFVTIAGPVHRDAVDVDVGISAAEDPGIDEMLAIASAVDVPPSRAPVLTDPSVPPLRDIRLGLVTPPPDA
jgi:hypothetical protein